MCDSCSGTDNLSLKCGKKVNYQPWVLGSKNLLLAVLPPAVAVIPHWGIGSFSRRDHPDLLLPSLHRLPLLVGLESHVGDAFERAGRRRVEAGGALAEVPGLDHADGPLGDAKDLRGQALAEFRGASQVHVQLLHQLLDEAQLRHHQPAPSIAIHALHALSSLISCRYRISP